MVAKFSKMQYLIIYQGEANYYQWYDGENHHVDGMIVIDLINSMYTTNGADWMPVKEDHL